MRDSGFFEAAAELERASVPFVVITQATSRGHAPQDPGAKAIVTEEGLKWGTVGGGKVEARAILHARGLLENPKVAPELVTWNLQRDIGMTCGGEVTYLFETHASSKRRIVIFGAGHVSQALVRAALHLPFQIVCIDAREEWVTKLPQQELKLKTIALPEPASWVQYAQAQDFFVVMTQGHATDVPILEALLRKFPEPGYIGAIGSDVKAIKLRGELKNRGIPDSSVLKLRCPIGLPLGTNHPGEIAISILTEIIQVRDSFSKA